MTDIATLGLAVDSRQVDDANRSLERFSQVSGSAERAARGVGREATTAGRAAAAANDNAANTANRAAQSYGRWEGMARRVSVALGAVAASLGTVVSFGAGVSSAIERLRTTESTLRRVDQALANSGAMAGKSAADIQSWADQLERSTGRAAEEVMNVSANLASFGFSEEVFFRAIRLADDMAAAWGGDLRQNLEGLARALENPEKGLAMLSARGITFTAEGRKMAIELAAMGRTAEAAGVLMEELESQVKGVAEAGFFGLTRAMAVARKSSDDFFDSIVRGLGLGTGLETALGRVSRALDFLTERMDIIIRLAGVAGVALLTAFAPSILAAMASGFVALGTAGVAAMTAITAAVMANPLGALAVAFTTVIAAAWLFRDEISAAIGTDITEIFKSAANTAINSFTLAYENIKTTWAALPAVMGQIVTSVVNGVIAGLEFMVNGAIRNINNLVKAANAATSMLPGGGSLQIPEVPEADFGRYRNRDGDAYGRLRRKMAGNARDIMGRDNFAGWSATDASGSSPNAAGVESLNDQIAAMNDNLASTPGMAGSAGGAMAKAAKDATDPWEGLRDVTKETSGAMEEAKGIANTFMSTLRQGLSNGEGFWKSFGNAALRVLDQIADRLQKLAIDNLFSNAAGGGGLFGGLLGGVGKLFGFSGGGWTGDGPRAGVTGVVHGQEFVVKAGPAAQHRQMLENMNAGRGPANSNVPQVIDVRLTDDSGRMAHIAQREIRTASGDIVRVSVAESTRTGKQQYPAFEADRTRRTG